MNESKVDPIEIARQRMNSEDFAKYMKVVESQQIREKPTWLRSNGQRIPIHKMNRYHLSAAMNKVHNFTLSIMNDQGSSYFQSVPPVYFDLKDEMLKRGMTIPHAPR